MIKSGSSDGRKAIKKRGSCLVSNFQCRCFFHYDRRYSHASSWRVGRSCSRELRENHRLASHGVYRWVRHPMYASIWLWGLAQGMMLANWFAGWAVMPALAAMYFIRTLREERLMCQEFGDGYRELGRLKPNRANGLRFRVPGKSILHLSRFVLRHCRKCPDQRHHVRQRNNPAQTSRSRLSILITSITHLY